MCALTVDNFILEKPKTNS